MNNASRSTIAIEIHKFLGQWIHFQNQFKKHFETYKSASASKLLAEQHKVLNKFLHLRLCNSKLELDHYCSLLNFIVKERVFELRGHSFSNGASKYLMILSVRGSNFNPVYFLNLQLNRVILFKDFINETLHELIV